VEKSFLDSVQRNPGDTTCQLARLYSSFTLTQNRRAGRPGYFLARLISRLRLMRQPNATPKQR